MSSVQNGSSFKIRTDIKKYNKPVDCQKRNAIYCIYCNMLPMQYIGEKDRLLQLRFSEHRGYVNNRHLKNCYFKKICLARLLVILRSHTPFMFTGSLKAIQDMILLYTSTSYMSKPQETVDD